MSKVRINDLAREMEVKSRQILDILAELGLAGGKTHSSSLEEDEAAKVRAHIERGTAAKSAAHSAAASRTPQAITPKIDLSHISKPGDVLKAIQAKRKEEEDTRLGRVPRATVVLRRRPGRFPLRRPIPSLRSRLQSWPRLQSKPRPARLRAKLFPNREPPQPLSQRHQLPRPLPPNHLPALWSPRLRQALSPRSVRWSWWLRPRLQW